MANKLSKRFIIGLALLASVGTLAGCADIEAKLPESEQSNKVLDLDGVTNNTLGDIYDTVITSGDSNSQKVLNNVLLAISNSKFGSFYTTDKYGVGLVEAVTTDAKLDAFITAHSVFQSEGGVVDANARARVRAFYKLIVEAIQKSLYTSIGNSNYQIRSIFFEKKFYESIKGDLYAVKDVAEADFKSSQISGTDNYKETSTITKYLNDDFLTVYQDYIDRSILPDVYRSKLVSQYLIEKNYGSLGRSYARKVQYVAVADNSSYKTATSDLVHSYIENVLKVKTADEDINLNFLSELYKGYFDWANLDATTTALIEQIYADANFEKVIWTDDGGTTFTYYKQTTYGGYLEDYKLIKTGDRTGNDSSKESDFTNSGAYTKETGLQVKTQSLITQDKTTEGWFPSTGLSDLPSDIKTRLFKTTVANEVDLSEKEESKTSDPIAMDYGYFIKGHYYLTPKKYDPSDTTPYAIYDSSSTTWYIVRVDEAIKSAKLGTGDGSYDDIHPEDPIFREKVAMEIANLICDNDTYKKSANQYYVEQAALSYHDQAVYDYFKATFPDLFD